MRFAADVEQVEVRDAKTDRVLLSLSGDALSSRMNPVGGEPAGSPPRPDDPARPVRIGGRSGSTWWCDGRRDLPEVLEHRVESSTVPTPGQESIPFTSVDRSRPARHPTAVEARSARRSSGIWGAGEGCCDNDTHHRRGLLVVDGNEVVPQRFAIDWMRLDEQHRAWVGDPHQLSSYLSYGQPLIAAAAGKVVVARDGFPDQPPPDNPITAAVRRPPRKSRRAAGRAGDVPALCAHEAGIRARPRGRPRPPWPDAGKLGNSGNSATPHLHLQVQTTRSFASDGLPFVFDRFRFLGRSPARTSPTRSSACGPTDCCPLPRRAIRVRAATRCRLIAASCGLRRAGKSRSRPANACTSALCWMRSPPCTRKHGAGPKVSRLDSVPSSA